MATSESHARCAQGGASSGSTKPCTRIRQLTSRKCRGLPRRGAGRCIFVHISISYIYIYIYIYIYSRITVINYRLCIKCQRMLRGHPTPRLVGAAATTSLRPQVRWEWPLPLHRGSKSKRGWPLPLRPVPLKTSGGGHPHLTVPPRRGQPGPWGLGLSISQRLYWKRFPCKSAQGPRGEGLVYIHIYPHVLVTALS